MEKESIIFLPLLATRSGISLVDITWLKQVTVKEDWVARAILHIAELQKFVVEGAGGTAIGSILAGLVPELAGKKVVCILSGGNIDTTLLHVCLDRALVAEQRMVKFKANIPARPGSMAELCSAIASTGASIKDIRQERAWIKESIFIERVSVVCETRGPSHVDELQELISRKFSEVWFPSETRGTNTTPIDK